MDDGWVAACSVVDAALDKKYGTAREKLDLERLKGQVLGAQEVLSANDLLERKTAMVQALVVALSQAQVNSPPAPPAQPIVVEPPAQPIVVEQSGPKPLRPRASFVPLHASGRLEWRAATDFVGCVSALYLGNGAADLGEAPWPCIILETSGLEPKDNDGYRACSSAFTNIGSEGGRCVYKGELQVAVGPATTFSLRGCDAGPVEVAWEGRIAERIANQQNALSRIHKLREHEPEQGGAKWWEDCWSITATDSTGKPCGTVNTASRDRSELTITPTAAGTQPSVVFLQGGPATLCVTRTTPPTEA